MRGRPDILGEESGEEYVPYPARAPMLLPGVAAGAGETTGHPVVPERSGP